MKKVAIVYDRINKWGGAERVLLALHEIFPEAPLYTSVYNSKKAPWAKVFPKVYTSFLQKLPIIRNFHELLGVFMPIAFESFNFSGYDLVISVTSEAAKGIITSPSTKHICYCLTPTRYLWSDYENYLNNPPKPLRNIPIYKIISKPILKYLRWWDRVACFRPDAVIAISSEVKKRIVKYYKRNSEIVFPPVDFRKFNQNIYLSDKRRKKGDYYLLVSRLVPYKKVDLVVETFNKLGKELVIVGSGSEERRLKKMTNKNIKFVKNLTDEELAVYYHNTRAFIMPQNEDFGIAAVEAQNMGTAVIAYKKGGALDIVSEGKTGVFFNSQTVEELKKAVIEFEKMSFSKNDIFKSADRFSKEKFIENIKLYI